mmetsp:Transcript_26176/g.61060  ORF Transcript_26176/g.61060 Transcript_26176/m.61060 type:complete len:210 (-) Transcript_26176:575-1204(-)
MSSMATPCRSSLFVFTLACVRWISLSNRLFSTIPWSSNLRSCTCSFRSKVAAGGRLPGSVDFPVNASSRRMASKSIAALDSPSRGVSGSAYKVGGLSGKAERPSAAFFTFKSGVLLVKVVRPGGKTANSWMGASVIESGSPFFLPDLAASAEPKAAASKSKLPLLTSPKALEKLPAGAKASDVAAPDFDFFFFLGDFGDSASRPYSPWS